MRSGYLRLAGAAGLVSLGLFAMTPIPAMADEAPTGRGYVSLVDVVSSNPPLEARIAPLPPCAVGTTPSGYTSGTAIPGLVSFGTGTTTCTLDRAGEARVEVTGRRFMVDLKRYWNGPIIRITSFKLSCNTVPNGSSSRMTVTGMSGIPLPNPIPANYTVDIPGARGGPPTARVVLNEVVLPEWEDGSMTVNLMRVQLFPFGGPAHGEVVAGTVHCSPRG